MKSKSTILAGLTLSWGHSGAGGEFAHPSDSTNENLKRS
jgi:hypothetical protein